MPLVGQPNDSALIKPAMDTAQKAAKAGKLKKISLKMKFKPEK
jgi:hypothetical protein